MYGSSAIGKPASACPSSREQATVITSKAASGYYLKTGQRAGPTSKGDFLPRLSSKDVSPDDIWFSSAGANFPPTTHIPIPTFSDLYQGFPRAQTSSKKVFGKKETSTQQTLTF